MRYVLVHLVRGRAGQEHVDITKKLTDDFDSFPLHDHIPPHLTLKRPFELEEGIEVVYKVIDDFARTHKQSDYEIRGFNHFDTSVIYEEIFASKEMKDSITELQSALNKVAGLPLDKFDKEQVLHATVAMASKKPFAYDSVWNFLQNIEQPRFDMKFDNVALLKYEDGKWHIDHLAEIGK